MNKEQRRTRRGGARSRRPRPTPRWLKERKEMDEMARRRCLMILSVLSGESTVSDAIEGAGMTRGTYYKLEHKALTAMVSALIPGADGNGAAMTAAKRIEELEAKVRHLEKEKRRRERLESVAKKLVGSGPMTTGRGGGAKKRSKRSSSSSPEASTRTRDGGVAR